MMLITSRMKMKKKKYMSKEILFWITRLSGSEKSTITKLIKGELIKE